MSKALKQAMDYVNTAYLKSFVKEEPKFNPLDLLRTEDNDEFEKKLTWLLMQPDYFWFLVKNILNIDMLPFQSVMLGEIWVRKFPMLIASRGASKLLRSDEKLRIKSGWTTMEQIQVGDDIYGSDGKLTKVKAKTALQTNVEMYKISLRDNRQIECCEDHLWKVWDKKKKDYIVLSTKEMFSNFSSDRKDSKSPVYKRCKEYRYAIPIAKPLVEEPPTELLLHPYIVGVLLGDGSLTTKSISIFSDDIQIIDRVRSLLPTGYKIESIESDNRTYSITRDGAKKPFYKLCQEIGIFGYKSEHKFIPKEYLFSSYEQKLELLYGLMDTDGGCGSRERNCPKYCTTSKQLAEDFLDLVRSCGFSCKRTITESYIGEVRHRDAHIVTLYTDKPVFTLKRKLTYLSHKKSKAGLSKISKTYITNIEYIGKGDGYCISVDNEDSTYITKDYIVTHNTFMLALYSLVRALLMKNRKILVAGAAFRQSKFVFEYMDTIWKNAPILRDICDQDSGMFKSNDRCYANINGSTVTCIPIGTGEKVRGYRAQDLIVEEFACLSRKSLIQTNLGLIRISDYLDGEAHELLNIDGKFEQPDRIFMTPKVDVYRVTTQYGIFFDASEIHQVMTKDGWKKVIDLTEKDHIRLGQNDFFPNQYIQKDGVTLDKDLGWLLGLLISEGTVTNRNFIEIVNTDKSLIDSIKDKFNFNWKESVRESHTNERGWNCKTSYSLKYSNTSFRDTLHKFGLNYNVSLDKTIPKAILLSPKDVVVSFLSGMYEGDGTLVYAKYRGQNELRAVLYSSSKELLEVTQQLLLKFGIYSSITPRHSGFKNTNYMLVTRGRYASKLVNLLSVSKWPNVEDRDTNLRKPLIAKRKNRYVLSTYQCNKNVYIGSFSTEEECHAAFKEYWENAPEYLNIKSVEKLPEKEVLYDFRMPKTHSFVANGFVQHNSHNEEIFETILSGFGNVSANPTETVKRFAAEQSALEDGIDLSLLNSDPTRMRNQILLSGTAFYDFNHFAKYWKLYKRIIESKGDSRKVAELFPEGVPDGFDHRDYSVIRLPYDILPRGFMDEGNVARSKASVHSSIFNMEFGAVFANDSMGFFKRSLIESCVSSEINNIQLPSGRVCFDAMIRGNPSKKYVIGIDPASEVDNFSIVVEELNPDHRRIVHCWTTTRKAHSERVKLGLTREDNFYSYCARKIRDLMKVFNVARIMMDSQGGGVAVNEALHQSSNLEPGELLIWPIIEEDNEKPTDGEVGLHILELVNFAKSDWVSEANHGLRKDFEDKTTLFPKFDPVILALSAEDDARSGRLYDTLEDCVMELEELKHELSLIEMTKTTSGRDRWDTPEVKTSGSKKSRMRKDRYSALLMCNMGARQLALIKELTYVSYGGFSSKAPSDRGRPAADFTGPAWFTEAIKGVYD